MSTRRHWIATAAAVAISVVVAGGLSSGPTAATAAPTSARPVNTETDSAPDSAIVQRLGGADRYETSIVISGVSWNDQAAGAVVLARGDNFPDALAGVPLAAHVGGPLLLTPPQALRADVRGEILRVTNRGATVFVLGGTDAVSSSVDAELVDLGYKVRRIAGANRYETAVAIARQLPQSNHVFLATGRDFPDALAASPPAASGMGTGGIPYPVLLTDGTKLGTPTARYLDELLARTSWLNIQSAGGPAAMAMWSELNGRKGAHLSPHEGDDRYGTAADIAERIYWLPGQESVGLASGVDFPDALGAASLLAQGITPLLLTKPESIPPNTAGVLEKLASYGPLHVFGGPVAVADSVARQAGVLMLPSLPEREISIGNELELQLNAEESVPLSFHAAEADEILVTASPEAYVTLFLPSLEPFGYTGRLGGGNSDWTLYEYLPTTGTYRLVVANRNDTANTVRISVANPRDLPTQDLVPDGESVALDFGPGQNVTLTFPALAAESLTLGVTQPGSMCAYVIVKSPSHEDLARRNLCGAGEYEIAFKSIESGTHSIRFDPISSSFGTVTFSLRSVAT